MPNPNPYRPPKSTSSDGTGQRFDLHLIGFPGHPFDFCGRDVGRHIVRAAQTHVCQYRRGHFPHCWNRIADRSIPLPKTSSAQTSRMSPWIGGLFCRFVAHRIYLRERKMRRCPAGNDGEFTSHSPFRHAICQEIQVGNTMDLQIFK